MAHVELVVDQQGGAVATPVDLHVDLRPRWVAPIGQVDDGAGRLFRCQPYQPVALRDRPRRGGSRHGGDAALGAERGD